MQLIIDRIEENLAICEKENGEHIEIEVSRLPSGCQEGSVLQLLESGEIVLDTKTEEERRKKLFNLTQMLLKGGKK